VKQAKKKQKEGLQPSFQIHLTSVNDNSPLTTIIFPD
jgi:hypothetical protein